MTPSLHAARLTRLIGACGLAFGLSGVLGLAAPAASASMGSGWLRLAPLSPNTPAVDVYLYSFGDPSAMVVLRHDSYGTVSTYKAVSSGEYTVALRTAGHAAGSKPVLSTTIDVIPGAAYTVAAMGPASGLRLQVLRDQLKASPGDALVRVIQASMHQTSVTVTAGNSVLGRNLNFTTVTSYRAVKPGDWAVHAVGKTEHGSGRLLVAAGSVYTVVVLDDSGQLKITGLEDSVGSKVTPEGAASLGFGGTAPRPGAPLLPWLGAAAAGTLIAAGGTIRLRRRPGGHAR